MWAIIAAKVQCHTHNQFVAVYAGVAPGYIGMMGALWERPADVVIV